MRKLLKTNLLITHDCKRSELMDTIANLLTIIRNGYLAKKQAVSAPYSKMATKILEILLREGYLAGVKTQTNNNLKRFEIELGYQGKEPAIISVVKVSKPGRRIYRASKNIPKTPTGFGITIVSTSKGVITANEAKKKNLGGEVICHVW